MPRIRMHRGRVARRQGAEPYSYNDMRQQQRGFGNMRGGGALLDNAKDAAVIGGVAGAGYGAYRLYRAGMPAWQGIRKVMSAPGELVNSLNRVPGVDLQTGALERGIAEGTVDPALAEARAAMPAEDVWGSMGTRLTNGLRSWWQGGNPNAVGGETVPEEAMNWQYPGGRNPATLEDDEGDVFEDALQGDEGDDDVFEDALEEQPVDEAAATGGGGEAAAAEGAGEAAGLGEAGTGAAATAEGATAAAPGSSAVQMTGFQDWVNSYGGTGADTVAAEGEPAGALAGSGGGGGAAAAEDAAFGELQAASAPGAAAQEAAAAQAAAAQTAAETVDTTVTGASAAGEGTAAAAAEGAAEGAGGFFSEFGAGLEGLAEAALPVLETVGEGALALAPIGL